MKKTFILLVFICNLKAIAQNLQQNPQISKDVSAIQNLGIKTISVCEPISNQVQLWSPDYSGTGWHEIQVYNKTMIQKSGRYLHILENKQEFDYNRMWQKFSNRDTVNYYFVGYLYDLENKASLPQLYVGWVLKKDIKVLGNFKPEIEEKTKTRFDAYLEKMQGNWIFDLSKPIPSDIRAKYAFVKPSDTLLNAGVKMNLVITGNTYKAYKMDYFTKNEKHTIINKNYKWISADNNEMKFIVLNYPLCDGNKIDVIDNKSLEEVINNPNRAQVVLSNYTTVCSEFGGNYSNIMNMLYWDDEKQTLFWRYYSPISQITFSGYCHRPTADENPPIRKAKIGLIVMDIDDNLIKEKGIYHKKGIYVDKAPEGGAGYDAEILSGDIILGVDNEEVTSTAKFIEIMSKHKPGDEIIVKILRESLADEILKRTVHLK